MRANDYRLGFFACAWMLWMVVFLSANVRSQQEVKARALPEGKLGEVIVLGEEIVEKTTSHPLSKPYVGNALNCTSCHLQNGKHPLAGTFLETASAYPAWSPRENRVITLEDRVLNCFMRSCNGKRPPLGSEVSIAVTAYITWLSQGTPGKMNPVRPIGPNGLKPLASKANPSDAKNGAQLYASRCSECHKPDGQGDEDNPPVWGEGSYNDGAGLASVDVLASWLKVAMPLDDSNLTDKESLDIAAYINSKKRSRFTLREHLPSASQLGEYNGKIDKD
jgi:thiosulfate dehydrogenase